MDINGIHKIYQIQSKITQSGISPKVSDSTQTTKNSQNNDKVQISSQGSFHAKLQAETKKYAAQVQHNTTLSADRIAQLKLKYQGDACPVSGEDVAKALLEKVCGSNHSED